MSHQSGGDRVYREKCKAQGCSRPPSGGFMVTQAIPAEQFADDPSSTLGADTFQWIQQWYPIAVAEFLNPSRPHAVQLLGNDLVLWRCFADACPHRLAPLLEGRVEADGTLLCAYHAWRFNAAGQCVRIPQALDAETEATHCANPKSCAIAYPTQEQQGLVWVWAESGAQAAVESQERSPRLVPELEESTDRVVKLFWNLRDLPYGWDFFMENVSDPAHVPSRRELFKFRSSSLMMQKCC